MSPKPGVILDMDGVIVNSNPAHKKAIQIFCENHDQHLSKEFLENRLYGRTNKEWIPELFGDISPDKLKRMANEKEQLFRTMFRPQDHIVAGIYGFLEELKSRHIPMAVATSAPVENANYILSSLDIESYFDAVLDSSHVSKGKPEPEIYLKAAGALQRKPENCIVFEDSVAGVQAGVASGATVVGVTTTHTAEELGACSLIISDFSSLKIDDLFEPSR